MTSYTEPSTAMFVEFRTPESHFYFDKLRGGNTFAGVRFHQDPLAGAHYSGSGLSFWLCPCRLTG